jgi:hypothetical protein
MRVRSELMMLLQSNRRHCRHPEGQDQHARPSSVQLDQKRMVYSPLHGDIAFTVPLLDVFMRRVIPMFEP